MTWSHRPLRALLVVPISALALLAVGCHKKPVAAASPATPPPPAAAKPTATLSADLTSINKGESVKLSWNTSEAAKVFISPEVGAVTPQGSTSVTPSSSVTYTLTASGAGGSAESSVRVSVNVAATAAHNESPEDLFLKDVRDAYFDYDSATIRPDARDALQKSADFLKNYPSAHVTVEGHCDERGSTEYNIALGQRRANAVKQYLLSLGVPADHVVATSWGKEKPFCNQENESCWQQNRRGHFTLNK